MKIIKKYIHIVDLMSEKTGGLVSWLTTVMALVVCYDVLMRYFFKISPAWTVELEWHLFALVFLMGTSFTLKYGKHVRVDILYNKGSERTRALLDFLGSIVLAVPFLLFIIWTSKDFAMESFNVRESSPNADGLPAFYILKGIMPVGFALLLLQVVSMALEALLKFLSIDSSPCLSEKENGGKSG